MDGNFLKLVNPEHRNRSRHLDGKEKAESKTMATLVPPPSKRQRLDASEKARQQQEVDSIPENLGSVRVQFFDQASGEGTGPAVAIPVGDSTVRNLEILLNTLQGNVGKTRWISSPLTLKRVWL